MIHSVASLLLHPLGYSVHRYQECVDYVNAGFLAFKNNEPAKALIYFAGALALNDGNCVYCGNIAQALDALGEHRLAADYWGKSALIGHREDLSKHHFESLIRKSIDLVFIGAYKFAHRAAEDVISGAAQGRYKFAQDVYNYETVVRETRLIAFLLMDPPFTEQEPLLAAKEDFHFLQYNFSDKQFRWALRHNLGEVFPLQSLDFLSQVIQQAEARRIEMGFDRIDTTAGASAKS